jgi:PhnB protein
MKNLIPYIIINDKCEEALNFYADCFGGKIVFMQKYADTNYSVAESFKSKVAHAEFRADNIHFFSSDGFEGQKATIGDNITMSINFDTIEEQKATFEKIKIGGTVTMDFSETSANSTLATLIDKYEIHWYLNYNKSE